MMRKQRSSSATTLRTLTLRNYNYDKKPTNTIIKQRLSKETTIIIRKQRLPYETTVT